MTGRPREWAPDAHDRLTRNEIPDGTIDYGNDLRILFGGMDGIGEEKVHDIERQLRVHPTQRFVFLGDDRQKDPEVFRLIAAHHPERVAAILIRRADGKSRDAADFPGVFFFDDYNDAIRHVIDLGLVSTAQ